MLFMDPPALSFRSDVILWHQVDFLEMLTYSVAHIFQKNKKLSSKLSYSRLMLLRLTFTLAFNTQVIYLY